MWANHRKKKASEVRRALGQPPAGEYKYLLDIDRMVQDLGIVAWDYKPTNPKEGSYLVYDGVNPPQMFINTAMDFRWQRWHMATWVAYVLLCLEPGVAANPPRKEVQTSLERSKERDYALNLLMPKSTLTDPYYTMYGDSKVLHNLYAVPEIVYVVQANRYFDHI